MVALKLDHNSLACRLNDLIGRGTDTPWLSSLSVLAPPGRGDHGNAAREGGGGGYHEKETSVPHDDRASIYSDVSGSRGEIVDLSFNRSLLADNVTMALQRITRAVWPALRAHSMESKERDVSVIIGTGEDICTEAATPNLSETLDLDLTQFWSEIDKGAEGIGIDADRVTLYTIRLANISYRIITITCHSEPKDWARFRKWRDQIKDDHGIDTRVSFQLPVGPTRSDASSVSVDEVAEKDEEYREGRDEIRITEHLQQYVVDWRDEELASYDGGIARKPEDLMKGRLRADNAIDLKVVLPLVGTPWRHFEPFVDTIAIGFSGQVQLDGSLVHCSAQPVVTHNTFPLDTASVSKIASMADFGEGSGDERVRAIRGNPVLVSYIRDLYEVARRMLSKQIISGSPVSLELASNQSLLGELANAKVRAHLQPEFVVNTVLACAQSQLATWCLKVNPSFPLITLRAHYGDNQTVADIQRNIPWFSEHSLYKPQERHRAASELRAMGREDMVVKLAALLRGGTKLHRLSVVTSADQVFPDDIFRFKLLRPVIGNVNNLQISAALLGSNPLEPTLVHEISQAVNRRRNEPSSSKGVLPEALEERILAANRSAAKHLGVRVG